MPEFLDQVRSIVDLLHCGVVIYDRQGVPLYVNPRLCEMMKIPRDRLTSLNVMQWMVGSPEIARQNQVFESFEQPRDGEYRLITGDGGAVEILASGRGLDLGDGQPINYRITTVVDISSQKASSRQIGELTDTVIEQARELRRQTEVLEERIRARTEDLRQSNHAAVFMLAVACEAKDDDTGSHIRRIEKLTQTLAQALGMNKTRAEELGIASILHDVGKIHVPDAILKKPGPLTDEERQRMQEHTIAGERILASHPFFEQARLIARHHHEDWDGSGYPDQLAGTVIPLEARIVHLVDVFDALSSKRVYKDAWPIEKVLAILTEGAEKQFDPELVTLFMKLWDRGDIAQAIADAQNTNRGQA